LFHQDKLVVLYPKNHVRSTAWGDGLILVDLEPLVSTLMVVVAGNLVSFMKLTPSAVKCMAFFAAMSFVSDGAMATPSIFEGYFKSFVSITYSERVNVMSSSPAYFVLHDNGLSRVRGESELVSYFCLLHIF
jgi:hypothetical protein